MDSGLRRNGSLGVVRALFPFYLLVDVVLPETQPESEFSQLE